MARAIFLIGLFFPALALAQLRIEASRLFYDGKQKVVIFEGRARGYYKGGYFEADRITYWPEERRVLAEGSCLLREGEDWIRASRITYDLEREEGTIEEGTVFISQRHFYVTGKVIKKVGKDRYILEGATLSSCDDTPPSWRFTAKRLTLKVEGYAQALWPGFEAKGVPIAYLPWAIFPVKRERQTGFLIPSFEYSNRYGPIVTVPFFWAISDNQDATFYLTRHGDGRGRGFKGGIEYRYALTSQSQGAIRTFALRDEVLKEDRWSLFTRISHLLPYGIKSTLNLNMVSDDRYPSDFEEDMPTEARREARSEKVLESLLDLRKTWSFGEASLRFQYFQDLETEEDEKTLHRLPEVTFKLFRRRLGESPLFFDLEAQGVNFFREEGYRGQRFEVASRFSSPLRPFGFLRLEPWARARASLYLTEDPDGRPKDPIFRVIPEGGFTLSATAFKGYRTPSGMVLHLVEPWLGLHLLPDVGQRETPLYEDRDRPTPEALWTLGIKQRLRLHGKGDLLSLSFAQPYDAFPGLEEKERLKPLEVELRLTPSRILSFQGDLAYDHQKGRFETLNAALDLDYKRVGLRGEYRLKRADKVEDLALEGSLKASENLDLWASYRYNFQSRYRVETGYGVRYRHQCWEVALTMEDIGKSPDGTQKAEWKAMVLITLRGVGSYGIKGGLER